MNHVIAKTILITQTIELIAKEYNLTIAEARDKFYKSDIIDLLDDDENELYGESSLYLFSLFEKHISKCKVLDEKQRNVRDAMTIEEIDNKFIKEFTKSFVFSDNLIKYQDDVVKDKYDHNYFYICNPPSKEEINKAIEYQKSLGLDFVKFVSDNDYSKLELFKDYEIGHNVGMMYMGKEYEEELKYELPNLEFKEASLEEVIAIEQKNFGEEYGYDFVIRASTEYYGHVKYLGAYIDNKMVAYCYLYDKDGIRNIDGLCTDIDYRRRGIATALIKHVTTKAHKCYLHADADDDPKKIYHRLGYRIVNDEYEYFLSLK